MRWWLNWFLYRDVTQSYWSSRYVFLLKQINIRHDISACWSTENNNKKKKNKFSIKWSKKPIIIGSPWNIAMHVIHLVPSFFISMSMIIILFVIRKDVPLYFHFTSIKTEQQYRTPLLQLLPSGEYFTKKKYFKEFIYNIHTELLNLVSLLANCCKLEIVL